MGKVIYLDKFRQTKVDSNQYETYFGSMDKVHLLEEMVKYQEWRSTNAPFTHDTLSKGIVLFKLLEENAETSELRELTRSYRRHLAIELQQLIQAKA